MQNLMYRFARFMQGRNGYDRYGRFLILTGLIIGLCGSIFHIPWLDLAGDLFFFYEIYRMFSKNVVKRGIENDHYLHMTMMLKHHCMGVRKQVHDRGNRYFVCPQCGQIVRIPRGHGRITITCPNCQCAFDRRS